MLPGHIASSCFDEFEVFWIPPVRFSIEFQGVGVCAILVKPNNVNGFPFLDSFFPEFVGYACDCHMRLNPETSVSARRRNFHRPFFDFLNGNHILLSCHKAVVKQLILYPTPLFIYVNKKPED